MKRSAADKSRNRRRFIRRGLITVCAVSCLTLVTGCAYRWMASRALEKEVASAERDANTGVLVGAEPLVLGTGERGVLLLHGFIGSPMDFGELPQRLADAGYRVRAPLLPGHGTRPQDMLKTDAAAWLEAARQAYREISGECEWVGIVGFSMGGMLAIRLAADDEERLPDALVLACPYLGVTYRWYAVLSPATWNAILSPAIPYVTRGNAFVQVNRREVAPMMVSYRTVPTYAIQCLGKEAADVCETVSGLPTDRTLILYAPGDGAASPRRILQMADTWGIPDAMRVEITNSNHLIFWDYNREAAIEAIIKHLNAFKTSVYDH